MGWLPWKQTSKKHQVAWQWLQSRAAGLQEKIIFVDTELRCGSTSFVLAHRVLKIQYVFSDSVLGVCFSLEITMSY